MQEYVKHRTTAIIAEDTAEVEVKADETVACPMRVKALGGVHWKEGHLGQRLSTDLKRFRWSKRKFWRSLRSYCRSTATLLTIRLRSRYRSRIPETLFQLPLHSRGTVAWVAQPWEPVLGLGTWSLSRRLPGFEGDPVMSKAPLFRSH